MRILIVGLPKSGTTILTYRVAAGLDGVRIDFEPTEAPQPGDGPVVTKVLVGTQTEDLRAYDHYDRRIWICRDPRDFLVSQALYRWHREAEPDAEDRAAFERIVARVEAKEADPPSVPFLDLEPAHYFETLDAVTHLWRREVDDRWLVFPYEDMVAGRYDAIDAYLGFPVRPDAEVADGLRRVERRKGSGDWRDWFTPDDVAFYRGGGLDRYMAAFGYDLDDWRLNDPQVIHPDHGSRYMRRLFEDAGVDPVRPGLLQRLLRRRDAVSPSSSRG